MTLAAAHGAMGIAVDATYVYWADTVGAGVVNKIPKSLTKAGTPIPVVTGAAAANVMGVASDGTYVYWTNKSATGQVHRALPTGGALTLLAANQSTPDWIATNGTIVAWTNQTSNQVVFVPIRSDGGVAPTVLNLVGELGSVPAGIAVDSAAVYYATKITGGGVAETTSLDGGAVRELGVGTYVSIAVDSSNVYWTGGPSSPNVYQNSKSGTPATVKIIASGALLCPASLVHDASSVYFFDQGAVGCAGTSTSGALYRVPVDNPGTLPAPLVTGIISPQGMAVDDSAIYWICGGASGAVMKVAK